MHAQLIKGLVVLPFLEVSKFMDADHLEQFGRCVFEQGGYANFVIGFGLFAMNFLA